jgi:Flp pilus assembly protein TadD
MVCASSNAVYLGLIVSSKHIRSIFLASALMALSACADLGLGLGDGQEGAVEEAVEDATNPVRQALGGGGTVADADRAIERKDFDLAYTILRQYLIVNPDDDAAKLSLARTYLGRSEGRNTQTVLNTLSEETKDSPRAKMLRGLALLVIGERVASAEQLELALAEDPSLWQAANGLGLIHDIEGNWDEAEASYKQALRIKTDSATAYNNLGYSYLLQGRIEDATEMFSTSLALDPEPVITRANLRLALAAKGRYADAIAGTERKDLPQVLNDIGYVAMLLGDYDSADTFFNRAIDESPIYYDAAVANLERLNTLIDQPAEQSPVTRVGRSVGN